MIEIESQDTIGQTDNQATIERSEDARESIVELIRIAASTSRHVSSMIWHRLVDCVRCVMQEHIIVEQHA